MLRAMHTAARTTRTPLPARRAAGAISFWNAEERRLQEDSKTHRKPVSCLMWSPNGERLVTADDTGKVRVIVSVVAVMVLGGRLLWAGRAPPGQS